MAGLSDSTLDLEMRVGRHGLPTVILLKPERCAEISGLEISGSRCGLANDRNGRNLAIGARTSEGRLSTPIAVIAPR